MSKPTGGEYLNDDIAYLSRNKFTHVVSLLETTEASELGLSAEGIACLEHNIAFEQIQIVDRSTPSSLPLFIESVVRSHQALVAGANLIAHCRAGIGRSGLYTTSILVHEGFSADEAFSLVSKARGLSIPDTQSQIDWIYAHEQEIRNAA